MHILLAVRYGLPCSCCSTYTFLAQHKQSRYVQAAGYLLLYVYLSSLAELLPTGSYVPTADTYSFLAYLSCYVEVALFLFLLLMRTPIQRVLAVT